MPCQTLGCNVILQHAGIANGFVLLCNISLSCSWLAKCAGCMRLKVPQGLIATRAYYTLASPASRQPSIASPQLYNLFNIVVL